MLFMQEVCLAFDLALERAGKSIAARMAMMAITTSSSINVKAMVFVPGRSPLRLVVLSKNMLRMIFQIQWGGGPRSRMCVEISQFSLKLSWHMKWRPQVISGKHAEWSRHRAQVNSESTLTKGGTLDANHAWVAAGPLGPFHVSRHQQSIQLSSFRIFQHSTAMVRFMKRASPRPFALMFKSFCAVLLILATQVTNAALTHQYSFSDAVTSTNAIDSVGGATGRLFPGASYPGNGTVLLDGSSGFVYLPDDIVIN